MTGTADPLLGTEVRRYRLVRLLGHGGMGRVYEGLHPDIGSRVAIKVIAEEYAHDATHAERFFGEARAVNLIRHDGIASIHDLDRLPDGRPVIVMELVDGPTLRQLIQQGPLPVGGLLIAIDQVLDALGAAHAIGIVHRDLKPDNIIFTTQGRAKLLDFGVAKLLRPTAGQSGPRTRTGVVMGTPEYMAPEQINDGVAEIRSDLYALGVVLFEALTGRRPFDAASDFALMRAHLEQPPPALRVLRPDVPAQVEEAIAIALAKRPQDRFANAHAMANALRHASKDLGADAWLPLVGSLPVIGRLTPAPEPAASDASPTVRATPAGRADGTREPSPRAAGLGRSRDPDVRRARRRTALLSIAGAAIGMVITTLVMLPQRQPVGTARHTSRGDAGVDAQLVAHVIAPDAEQPAAASDAGVPFPGAAIVDVDASKLPPARRPHRASSVDTKPKVASPTGGLERSTSTSTSGASTSSGSGSAAVVNKQPVTGRTVPSTTSSQSASGKRLEVPYTGHESQLDPATLVAEATKAARKLQADAKLLRFGGSPVRDRGYVWLRPEIANVTYTFWSASGASCVKVGVKPPHLVVQEISRADCETDYKWRGETLRTTEVAAPGCRLPAIIQRVDDNKIPEYASMGVSYDGKWHVAVYEMRPPGADWNDPKWKYGDPLKFRVSFADDC